MYNAYQSPCCYRAPAVTTIDQVWPTGREYTPGTNPYYVNRGDNYRIIYQYASINNQAVQMGEPIYVRY